jgi:hypothetical protein
MMPKNQMATSLQKLLRMFMLLKVATSYLEPGSSSFLLKILISSLVAFAIFFRQIWGYVRLVWARLSGKQAEPVELETAVPDQPPQNEIQ